MHPVFITVIVALAFITLAVDYLLNLRGHE